MGASIEVKIFFFFFFWVFAIIFVRLAWQKHRYWTTRPSTLPITKRRNASFLLENPSWSSISEKRSNIIRSSKWHDILTYRISNISIDIFRYTILVVMSNFPQCIMLLQTSSSVVTFRETALSKNTLPIYSSRKKLWFHYGFNEPNNFYTIDLSFLN